MKEDNPSAFKHWISEELVKKMAMDISTVFPQFNVKSFLLVSKKLAALELKHRVLAIREALHEQLPQDYLKALKIILAVLEKDNLKGFDLWPFTEFIQTYGLEHFDESLQALSILTQKFTAEFAVRPFLVQYPEKTYSALQKWAKHPNHHIRRWTSEGSRPRLPWGMKLHSAIRDPKPGIKILNLLKFDEELYVRKSIANHLNDITKDHPDLVISTLKEWNQKCPDQHQEKLLWVKKQALRSLIKSGYLPALTLMGYGKQAQIKIGKLKINKNKFELGEVIDFELQLISTVKKMQKIAVDYIIHYQKSNMKTSPKVFKLKVLELKPGETFLIKKRHSLRPVTTRKHYPGLHKIEVQINGKVLASADWHLIIT